MKIGCISCRELTESVLKRTIVGLLTRKAEIEAEITEAVQAIKSLEEQKAEEEENNKKEDKEGRRREGRCNRR